MTGAHLGLCQKTVAGILAHHYFALSTHPSSNSGPPIEEKSVDTSRPVRQMRHARLGKSNRHI
jgi:hypothetical protein